MTTLDAVRARPRQYVVTVWTIVGWSAFGVMAAITTMPIWRLAIVGMNPALDEFLASLCTMRPS